MVGWIPFFFVCKLPICVSQSHLFLVQSRFPMLKPPLSFCLDPQVPEKAVAEASLSHQDSRIGDRSLQRKRSSRRFPSVPVGSRGPCEADDDAESLLRRLGGCRRPRGGLRDAASSPRAPWASKAATNVCQCHARSCI